MTGLDFRRASDLFMGTERELAMALGMGEAELKRLRQRPETASADAVRRLAAVLAERARGMARVAQILGTDA